MNTANKFLPKEFKAGFHDVLIGRGKKCYEHSGNKKFLALVASRLSEYSAAGTKIEKSKILSSVVSEIQMKSPIGGFIKKDSATGLWFQVGEFLAREKTSQAFRDALHDSYKSSNSSRKKRRKTKNVDTPKADELVKLTFSYDQQCDTSSQSSNSVCQTSSLHSNVSDKRCHFEVFDNESLDEILPPDNIDLDLHDFNLENNEDVSMMKLEEEDEKNFSSFCDSLIFDNDIENDEFETGDTDLKQNKLFEGKLFEDEAFAYSDMYLSFLYPNKQQMSFYDTKLPKFGKDTQTRSSNINKGFTSIPRRKTSVAMTA